MAAKRVASALDVLTGDGVVSCEEWSDHTLCAAFVADYFTTGSDDSSEESDNDDTGNFSIVYNNALQSRMLHSRAPTLY